MSTVVTDVADLSDEELAAELKERNVELASYGAAEGNAWDSEREARLQCGIRRGVIRKEMQRRARRSAKGVAA